MARIVFDHVVKSYPRHPGRQWFRDFVAQSAKQRNQDRLLALKDVSFTIENGDSVGIIGRNGAGKSTLLLLAAKLLLPDSGNVLVEGRIANLLDLGAGFHPDLTGRENVVINAALLGLSKQEIAARMEGIVEYSGLGSFIDQQLRTYSSGMAMRLAFAVSVAIDPDVLLVDEVLAVGDKAFQSKCLKRMKSLQERGSIFLCASHDTALLSTYCEKAIWLEQGKLMLAGKMRDVARAYLELHSRTLEIRPEESEPAPTDAA